jgi:hypothetical protein
MKKSKTMMTAVLAAILAVSGALALTGCDNDDGSGGDPAISGTVTISGTVKVGQELTAETTAVAASGPFSFTWLSAAADDGDYSAISGATAGTYTLTNAEEDTYIKVQVSSAGYSGSVTSAAKGPVASAGGTVIPAASVSGLVAPAAGAEPTAIAALSVPTGAAYSAQSITWSPSAATFAPATAYTATIVLKADADYKFSAITPTVDAGTAAAGTISADTAQNTLTFAVAFDPTGILDITAASITGLAAPVAGAAPVTALTAGASTYAVQSVAWNTSPATFLPLTAYTATIALKANAGYRFTALTPTVDAGTAAAGTISGGTDATGENILTFTVPFPATGLQTLSPSIGGLTAPAKTVQSSTALTGITAGTGYSVTSLTWKDGATTFTGPFVDGTVYKAQIVLTAAYGYQFVAGKPGVATVGNPGTVDADGTITAAGATGENALTFIVTFPAAGTGPAAVITAWATDEGGIVTDPAGGAITISRSAGSLAINVTGGPYSSYQWYVDGAQKWASNGYSYYSFDVSHASGKYDIGLTLTHNNKPYSKTFTVTVTD